MDEELAKLYIPNNDVFGLPQTYKGITLYPIKISESRILESFYNLMAYPKNFGAPKEIFKMSYIKFMIYRENSEEGIEKKQKEFEEFLSYISKTKVKLLSGIKDENAKPSLDNIYINISFDDIILDEWEFEEIRAIILEQNSLSIEWVNQFNQELEEKVNFHRKKNPLNFADQIFTMSALGKEFKEIAEYTLYQLQNIFERMITKEEYDLYQPALITGAIKLKTGEIKHWLYHKEKGKRYDDILIPMDKYLNKNKELFGGVKNRPQSQQNFE